TNPASHRSLADGPGRSWLQDCPLDFATRGVTHRRLDGGGLSSGSCLALAGSQWFQLPTTGTPGGGTGRKGNPSLAANGLAGIKKKPGNKGEPSSLLTKAA